MFFIFFSKFCGEDTCLNLPWEFSPFVLCIDAFEGMRFKWIWNKSTNAIRRGRKENEHQYQMHIIMDENSTLQTIKPDEHQYQRNLRIEWEAEKKNILNAVQNQSRRWGICSPKKTSQFIRNQIWIWKNITLFVIYDSSANTVAKKDPNLSFVDRRTKP